jgi:hypothetical protein
MWITDTCEWLCDENRESDPPAPPADDMPPSPQTSVKAKTSLGRTKSRNLNKFESLSEIGDLRQRACAAGLQLYHKYSLALAYEHALNDSFIEKKEQIYSKMHYDIAMLQWSRKILYHKSEE